ncbi:ATP-binding cassette domain-containing protein [Candidatus Peribacteria bacterium]|nr:ATP-binding cassette domain-containing protein [Candidatus Peribacteria bacterium]
MIRAHGLTKSYGNHTLLQEVSFTIHENETVGLMGRNGHGKTTLLQMIAGDILPEKGEIHLQEGAILERLSQHVAFTKPTVHAEACTGLRAHEAHHTWLASKLLYGLGFSEAEQHLPPQHFSGGFQVRILLARALLSRPDILLLDEPTNYLDITSLRWLEGMLRHWKGTIVLVTHDRTFMEAVVTHTMAIHRQGVRKVAGGPEKLQELLLAEEEIHERTRQNQEKKDEQTAEFLRNFRAGARSAGLVQSRIKAIAKQKRLPKLPPIPPVRFSFSALPFEADALLKASSLRYQYAPDAPELLHGLSLTIAPQDRIAIVGPNGRGKSTLLEVLAGVRPPTSGSVKYNKDTALGSFRQMHHGLPSMERTVFEELRSYSALHSDEEIHKLCGSLMFTGEKRYRALKVLSGGERSRLQLGKLMLQPHNLLLLDEPTNHLDMESCAALATALEAYPGAVVCVTHDEALLRSFARKLVVFDDGQIFEYRDGYDAFLTHRGWTNTAPAMTTPPKPSNPDYRHEKELRRARRPYEKQVAEMEERILATEAALQAATEQLSTAHARGQQLRIYDLSVEVARLTVQVQEEFTALEQLHHTLDSLSTTS